MSAPVSRLVAIQRYFSEGKHGRNVTTAECRQLTPDDRRELGNACAAELGLAVREVA
jgi:hypothetical protein